MLRCAHRAEAYVVPCRCRAVPSACPSMTQPVAELVLLGDDTADLRPWSVVGWHRVEVLGEARRSDDLSAQGVDVEVDDVAVSLLHLRRLLAEGDEEVLMDAPTRGRLPHRSRRSSADSYFPDLS